jgi:hypothetical protein
MKYKIQKLINSCSNCEFAREYKEGGSTEYVLICKAEVIKNDETTECDSFLITSASEPIKRRFNIGIPNNCPLETYETN